MSEFFTQTEKSFNDLMNNNNVLCSKIFENKIDKVPDFLCEANNYKVIFELKDLNESGTTTWLMPNMLARKNTIESTISRFIEDASKKFLNNTYISFDSGLVVTNFRSLVDFQNNLMPQVESIIKDKLSQYPEIGNFIITGYSKPTNRIIALHIFENKNSKRVIKKDFFNNFNHTYCV